MWQLSKNLQNHELVPFKVMFIYKSLCTFSKADTDIDEHHSSKGIGNHCFYLIS